MSAFKFYYGEFVMNINNVYIAKIFIKTDEEHESIGPGLLDFNIISSGIFLKNTLVLDVSKKRNGCYRDLLTGKRYTDFSLNDINVGESYLMLDSLVSLSSILKIENKNISKRKILKKYNESIKSIENNNK